MKKIILFIVVFYSISFTQNNDKGAEFYKKEYKCKAFNVHLIVQDNSLYVVGKIKNSSTINLKTIAIIISFYNKDGYKVGEVYAPAYNVGPGETDSFRKSVFVQAGQIKKIKISDIWSSDAEQYIFNKEIDETNKRLEEYDNEIPPAPDY